MHLNFDHRLAENYSSTSQKIRVMSESWVAQWTYCPNCGQFPITQYANNKPVADYYCSHCAEVYELKSMKSSIGTKIMGGAYEATIERLSSSTNPNLLLIRYNPVNYILIDFVVISKHFLVPDIIVKRKPLAPTARRAGWVGCYIDLTGIPESGKLYIVKFGQMQPKPKVLEGWQQSVFLRHIGDGTEKSWILDVMHYIDVLHKDSFKLADIYQFESLLSQKHPNNQHIRDKIRQQLQVLRDQGYLQFTSRGNYKVHRVHGQ